MYEYTSNLYKHGLSNNNKKLRLLTTVHVYVVQCPKNNLDLCKRPSEHACRYNGIRPAFVNTLAIKPDIYRCICSNRIL